MIDGSVVRLHQHGSGSGLSDDEAAIGRSRGGLSTKIHAKVDARGHLLRIELSGGQSSEMNYAEQLMHQENCHYLLADKGYDSNNFRSYLALQNIEAVIPPKANRNAMLHYDKEKYKERNQVERFFCRIKSFRRIATRYDKLAIMFRASIVLVSIILWLKL